MLHPVHFASTLMPRTLGVSCCWTYVHNGAVHITVAMQGAEEVKSRQGACVPLNPPQEDYFPQQGSVYGGDEKLQPSALTPEQVAFPLQKDVYDEHKWMDKAAVFKAMSKRHPAAGVYADEVKPAEDEEHAQERASEPLPAQPAFDLRYYLAAIVGWSPYQQRILHAEWPSLVLPPLIFFLIAAALAAWGVHMGAVAERDKHVSAMTAAAQRSQTDMASVLDTLLQFQDDVAHTAIRAELQAMRGKLKGGIRNYRTHYKLDQTLQANFYVMPYEFIGLQLAPNGTVRVWAAPLINYQDDLSRIDNLRAEHRVDFLQHPVYGPVLTDLVARYADWANSSTACQYSPAGSVAWVKNATEDEAATAYYCNTLLPPLPTNVTARGEKVMLMVSPVYFLNVTADEKFGAGHSSGNGTSSGEGDSGSVIFADSSSSSYSDSYSGSYSDSFSSSASGETELSPPPSSSRHPPPARPPPAKGQRVRPPSPPFPAPPHPPAHPPPVPPAPALKTKFWGFVITQFEVPAEGNSTVSLTSALDTDDYPSTFIKSFSWLASGGYSYKVTSRYPVNCDSQQRCIPSLTAGNHCDSCLYQEELLYASDTPVRQADMLKLEIQMPPYIWVLQVSRAQSTTPEWRVPVMAAVVVAAFIMAALLFVALLKRKEANYLLATMMPPKAIRAIKRGHRFAEPLDSVAVLFSDIVSYTSMSSGMDPMDVVEVLNIVFSKFDALSAAHGVYKLDIVGDGYICVAGAPDREDPVSAACRVVRMALAMIDAAGSLELPDGRSIRIRVGVHVGPAVAAVVGRRVPRYTLFGDTVNVASRLESSGAPMRVHVSEECADQLHEYNLKCSGAFDLEYRGETELKGKGVRPTYWVSRPHSATGNDPAQLPADPVSEVQASLPSMKAPPNKPFRATQSSTGGARLSERPSAASSAGGWVGEHTAAGGERASGGGERSTAERKLRQVESDAGAIRSPRSANGIFVPQTAPQRPSSNNAGVGANSADAPPGSRSFMALLHSASKGVTARTSVSGLDGGSNGSSSSAAPPMLPLPSIPRMRSSTGTAGQLPPHGGRMRSSSGTSARDVQVLMQGGGLPASGLGRTASGGATSAPSPSTIPRRSSGLSGTSASGLPAGPGGDVATAPQVPTSGSSVTGESFSGGRGSSGQPSYNGSVHAAGAGGAAQHAQLLRAQLSPAAMQLATGEGLPPLDEHGSLHVMHEISEVEDGTQAWADQPQTANGNAGTTASATHQRPTAQLAGHGEVSAVVTGPAVAAGGGNTGGTEQLPPAGATGGRRSVKFQV